MKNAVVTAALVVVALLGMPVLSQTQNKAAVRAAPEVKRPAIKPAIDKDVISKDVSMGQAKRQSDMDRRAKASQTLSNASKKQHDAASSAISNMK